MSQQKLVSVDEYARMKGVSKSHIYSLMKDSLADRVVKKNGTKFIDISDRADQEQEKKTSNEKGRAIPGASMALRWERLMDAFSASCSWDIPRIFRSVEIAIPNCMNLSRFLNAASLLICITCLCSNYTLF